MKNQTIPKADMLSDVDLYCAYRKWRDPAGLFECYVKSTCFVTLKHYPDFPVQYKAPARDSLYRRVAEHVKETLPGKSKTDKTLILLDLPAKKVLSLGLLLNQEERLIPILTLRELYHPQGLVGSQDEAGRLLTYGAKLQTDDPKGYLFLLDAGRSAEYDFDQTMRFNNRYTLTYYDLPTSEMLYDAGYRRLLLLHSGAIRQDVADYIGQMRLSGFHASTIRIEGCE